MILVVIDAHSKWIEAISVPSTSSISTITVLKNLFATHGILELIFSDNGTSFTSEEFGTFCKRDGIRHKTSAPFHPTSNGLTERAVQVVKAGLRKNKRGSMDLRLAQILFKYRLPPHSTTGVTPAELLIGRKPRTHLDLLHPDLSKRVEEKQSSQKQRHDSRRTREREFKLGDSVYAMYFQTGDRWLQGKISKVLGTRNYLVELNIGKMMKRRVNQLK